LLKTQETTTTPKQHQTSVEIRFGHHAKETQRGLDRIVDRTYFHQVEEIVQVRDSNVKIQAEERSIIVIEREDPNCEFF